MKKEYRPEFKDYIGWSPHRLETWLTCPRKYFFEYVAKIKIPTPPEFARGIELHKHMRRFFNKEGKPHYKSEESFANAIKFYWKNVRESGKVNGQEIIWTHEKQPFWIQAEMIEILKTVYGFYINQEPPISTEKRFKVIVSDFEDSESAFCLTGKIDEIRRNLTIRDHKSRRGTPKEEKWDDDYQLTIYTLGLAGLVLDDEHLTSKILDGRSFSSLFELATKTDLEIHLMREGRIITAKHRADRHFKELFNTLRDAEERIKHYTKTGNWPTNLECDCGYYREHCKSNAGEDYQLQLFNIPTLLKKRKDELQLKLELPRVRRARKKKKEGIQRKNK